MPKKFIAPDPNEKQVLYGAEVVRRINEGASEVVPAALESFDDSVTSPEPDPALTENGQGEPDPQGDSAATEKEN